MTTEKSVQNRIYPKAPLVEAILEIRFPGDPAVECHRDEIYSAFKKDFPKVLVPRVVAGEAPALGLYRFESEDAAKLLMVSINTFSFSSKKYPGFLEFSSEAMRYMAFFGKRFNLSKMRRVGLRYINAIPYTRENKVVPIKNFLNFGFNLPALMPQDCLALETAFTVKANGGVITTRIACLGTIEKTQEALLLDFDYSKEENLDFKHLQKYLQESHDQTKKFFEALITDQYREVMRGEII